MSSTGVSSDDNQPASMRSMAEAQNANQANNPPPVNFSNIVDFLKD